MLKAAGAVTTDFQKTTSPCMNKFWKAAVNFMKRLSAPAVYASVFWVLAASRKSCVVLTALAAF
jgi:hypothetical protein